MDKHNKRIVLLGILVDNVNMDEALENIMEMTEQYKRDFRNRLVATVNVDFFINAHKGNDKQKAARLLSILRKADMVTADGMPMVWLSKLLGNPLKGRVTGADMVPALANAAAAKGKSIYLLGGKDGSAQCTAEILQAENPGLKIAGVSSPMIDLDNVQENKNIIARINITNPDIFLIALGNPKQELWFERYRKYLRVPVSIGIGGTFELISGITSRAPEWIQKAGLEWIYRIIQDPKRLIKRYAVGLISFNLMVLPLLVLHFLSSFIKSKTNKSSANTSPCFLKTHQGVSVAWKEVNNSIGMGLLFNQLKIVKRLTLDFKQITKFTLTDIIRLMNIFLTAKKLDVNIKVLNLSLIAALTLRANRIFDLIKIAG